MTYPVDTSLSEADTRAKLIDPAIRKCGWTEDMIRREETVGSIEIIGGKARRCSRGQVGCHKIQTFIIRRDVPNDMIIGPSPMSGAS